MDAQARSRNLIRPMLFQLSSAKISIHTPRDVPDILEDWSAHPFTKPLNIFSYSGVSIPLMMQPPHHPGQFSSSYMVEGRGIPTPDLYIVVSDFAGDSKIRQIIALSTQAGIEAVVVFDMTISIQPFVEDRLL